MWDVDIDVNVDVNVNGFKMSIIMCVFYVYYECIDGISLTFNNAPAPPSYSCYTPYITTIIDLQCDPTGMKQMKISPAPCIHEIILPTVLVCPGK